MDDPRSDREQEPAPGGTDRGVRRQLRLGVGLALVAAVVGLAAVEALGLATGDSRPSAPALIPSSAPSSSADPAPSPPGPAMIAVVDANGALATMDERGGSLVSYAVPGVVFGFPAWSPDGSRVAVVGQGPDDTGIYVFTVLRGRSGAEVGSRPVVIYRSADRPPFYLYWTPDGRRVAFLATEPVGLSLRITPADGSAPLDGSAPAAIIRRGAPLYFDWLDPDRLLLHVGAGPDAFVGEVDGDGASVGPGVPGTGDFRPAGVSRDRRYRAYVRSDAGSSGQIVVESRDGSGTHEVPVFGPAAMVFDPSGDRLAAIGADTPVADASAFPLGPLRLIDAGTGAARTLLDGSVLAFFWAPDGRTIAALRLGRPGDDLAAETGIVLAAARPPHPTASGIPRAGDAVVSVVFVDASTGVVRSQRVVRLADHFVTQLLPYFDQYALSHRLWSPDGTSILLPLVDKTGRDQLVVVSAEGPDPRPIADGVSGFWSP